MLNQSIHHDLCGILGENAVFKDVPMKTVTSIKTGGIADFLVEPGSYQSTGEVIHYLNRNAIPFYIIGNGTNLIVSDQGLSGVVVKIGTKLSEIEVEDSIIRAQAGASLALVASKALENRLTGLEFASGIPGYLGGAAAMNAGAYDGEMRQVITKTTCMDQDGKTVILTGDEHDFSYRGSRILKEKLTVLEVEMALEEGSYDRIRAKMLDLNSRRKEKQPLEMPSAGSVFKRPEGHFAGKLIENCGLRGFTIGGAMVSEKHCGFIVNKGDASTKDVTDLIHHIRNTVYEKTGVMLEPEVRIIGGR